MIGSEFGITKKKCKFSSQDLETQFTLNLIREGIHPSRKFLRVLIFVFVLLLFSGNADNQFAKWPNKVRRAANLDQFASTLGENRICVCADENTIPNRRSHFESQQPRFPFPFSPIIYFAPQSSAGRFLFHVRSQSININAYTEMMGTKQRRSTGTSLFLSLYQVNFNQSRCRKLLLP